MKMMTNKSGGHHIVETQCVASTMSTIKYIAIGTVETQNIASLQSKTPSV